MFHRHGMEKIYLPPDTKAIRDICVLPGGDVVFASLGRKLSLFRSVNKVCKFYSSLVSWLHLLRYLTFVRMFYILAWPPTMLSFNVIYR